MDSTVPLSRNSDVFSLGQTLDREPSMGQVPVVPPGTPPNESWLHYNGHQNTGYMGPGRHSPNVPVGQDSLGMVGAPGMGRVLPSDVSDSENFGDYSPRSTPSHVEVY